MSEHILFYSKRCPNCTKLFDLLNRSPRLQNQFLSVCIDDRRFKVPKCIRSVPSAIIPSPTGEPQVFSGTNLFNWVKKRLPMNGGQGGQGGAGRGGMRPPPSREGPGGGGRGRGGGGRGRGGGGPPQEAQPEEWDAFVMNNLSGAFSYIDERQNDTLVEKTQALLQNIENMHIHTVDDDGDGKKPNITAVSYDPSSAGAPSQGGGGGGGGRSNPFSQRSQPSHSQSYYEEEEYGGGSGGGGAYQDNSIFRDQGYEGGSDARRSARKNDFDAKLEEMKRNRDFGMPQPIRRM